MIIIEGPLTAFMKSKWLALVKVLTALGLLFLKLIGGILAIFISYHIIRIIFMGITKLKERIDSIIEWKNRN